MVAKQKAAIFIPSRMTATRLPGKALANINGKPMVLHVLDRAKESGIENIYVTCPEQEIVDIVSAAGGKAILTDPAHPSGTDRIHEALKKTGGKYDYIVSLQGDLPLINPQIINVAINVMRGFPDADIATLAAIIKLEDEKTNPNVVKVVASARTDKISQALYFTRATAPYGEGELLHHIGLYVYTPKSLDKFVKLGQSPLEKREKLEQLRALENNMKIYVATVDAVPLGVDTQEDLEKVKKIMRKK